MLRVTARKAQLLFDRKCLGLCVHGAGKVNHVVCPSAASGDYVLVMSQHVSLHAEYIYVYAALCMLGKEAFEIIMLFLK
jgi:hypothetical protein